jgi:PKD repeat protein
MKNGIVVGTNDSIYIDSALLNNDLIRCSLISNEKCVNPVMVASEPITMAVNETLTPTIAIIADQNPICAATFVTFISAITNGGTNPIYQWKKNDMDVGTNTPIYSDNGLANNDVITCTLTSNESCADPPIVTSNPITMIVTVPLVPTITIVTNNNPICAGTLVTFTSVITNGGTNPVYQWKRNDMDVGTSIPTYSDYGLANNDVVTCTLISSETCVDPDTAISNAIVIMANPAMVTIISDHTDVMFFGNTNGSAKVTVTGGTPEYSYVWNTLPIQTTQTATNLSPGSYQVTVTDLLGCTAIDSITITGPSQPLTVAATSTDVNCVDANNGTATATVSGGTPGYTYQWNDPMMQTTATAIHLFAGTYTVVVTDTNHCTAMATVSIGEPVTREPQITIAIDNNPICRRTLVHFTSNVIFPGSNPSYQWIKNGVNVGTSDSVYSDSTLNNNDVISCILTSSEQCAIPATKMSDGIRIIVKEPPVAAFTYAEISGNIPGQIQLNNMSHGANSYYWDFGNGQTSNEENPTVNYDLDGNYLIRLVAMNEYSCTDTAWNKYKVEFYGLYIPNAFAPESSSTPANLFKPAGTNLKQYRIEVYDNWGHLLWESTALDSEGSPSEAWDGRYKGILMPQGTYMWKVNAIFNDNTIWQGCDIGKGKGKTIGTVTLIR